VLRPTEQNTCFFKAWRHVKHVWLIPWVVHYIKVPFLPYFSFKSCS
jgi:hypothetical protein